MKKIICYFILALGIISCSSDDKTIQGEFEFISQYTTNVTVGGVVGVHERTFEKGETYKGTDEGKKTITIRITDHSELNSNCPNSLCSQELLEVPREFLKFVK
ncbi:hypothetical protein CLU83_2878 [Flavobacterium sp. 1]|uniref:hypothetical protein n=1 Tax=Flavobacterium sp. 1 TaxID=2035200 RepID=UPI000C23E386|nr:hypothetical protein [Flavobacterium sp. 1]PJJ09514.1 hypothetical protein CLU83_2878 [Flavobacterium sp. 1]